MICENKYKHKDRNGLDLKYGDKVFLKSYWKNMYLFTIIGFTNNYVACLCGSQVFYRNPNNIVKVSNAEKWKRN